MIKSIIKTSTFKKLERSLKKSEGNISTQKYSKIYKHISYSKSNPTKNNPIKFIPYTYSIVGFLETNFNKIFFKIFL